MSESSWQFQTNEQQEWDTPQQATPHAMLIDALMDSTIPKTEREHAAVREIQMLREALRGPKQWAALTLEEIEDIIKGNVTITDSRLYEGVYAVVVDIEVALKEKNT